jgi:hypothetical protein
VEREIDDNFARAIAGLRRLPRHERPYALRAAKEARDLARKALHEKREIERHANHLLSKLKMEPSPT